MTSTLPFKNFTFQNSNNSASNVSVKQLFILKQPTYMIAIYSIAYSVVFLCALFGNLMVVTVVGKNRAMRTVTNCFIVNLAVADILVAVFNLPITLLSNLYLGKFYIIYIFKFWNKYVCRLKPTALTCKTHSFTLQNPQLILATYSKKIQWLYLSLTMGIAF